jgi:DMSO/TMAO reductase YedYZ molybdopterin-dependent catalytic subunit
MGRQVATIEIKKLALISIMLTTIVVAAGYTGRRFLTNPPVDDPGPLAPVEIREYQGQPLSSIGDFRENSIQGPQMVDNDSYRLTVTGLVQNEMAYTYDDVITTHRPYAKVVTLYCVEGWDVTILWEGVLLTDLLAAAGILPTATVVIFYAYDGYSTSLPLDYIISNNILVAYKMNNVTLSPERGFPFQLVAESKLGYKWIKWLTAIELSDNEAYRGYWESRGFPNEADLP